MVAELLTNWYGCDRRRFASWRWRSAALVGLLVTLAGSLALCTMPAESLRTARAQELRAGDSTLRTASIYWDRVPVRDALARATQVYGEPVILDRRVDPMSRVTMRAEAASLDDVMRSVADSQSLGSSRLKGFRYIGPVQAADELRTIVALHEQNVASLDTALRSTLTRETVLTWPRLTEPRELVINVARRSGWKVSNADRIPHDLWSAGELPKSTGIEQLAVLLIGFDLTFSIQAERRNFELRPLERVTIERRYQLKSGFTSLLDRLRQELPAAAIRIEGKSLVIDGRIEDHERWLALSRGQLVRPQAEPRSPAAKQVYTLRVEQQPVDAILRQLAERLNWEIDIDENSIGVADKSLSRRVSFAVENCDQHELLEAVLQPAGLAYRRDGARITVVAREFGD